MIMTVDDGDDDCGGDVHNDDDNAGGDDGCDVLSLSLRLSVPPLA